MRYFLHTYIITVSYICYNKNLLTKSIFWLSLLYMLLWITYILVDFIFQHNIRCLYISTCVLYLFRNIVIFLKNQFACREIDNPGKDIRSSIPSFDLKRGGSSHRAALNDTQHEGEFPDKRSG